MKDTIIIHCSATRAGQDFTATDIDRWHRQRGFRSIVYHFVIRLDGTIEPGRDVALDGAHCTGWNHRSIGICFREGKTRRKSSTSRTSASRCASVRVSAGRPFLSPPRGRDCRTHFAALQKIDIEGEII